MRTQIHLYHSSKVCADSRRNPRTQRRRVLVICVREDKSRTCLDEDVNCFFHGLLLFSEESRSESGFVFQSRAYCLHGGPASNIAHRDGTDHGWRASMKQLKLCTPQLPLPACMFESKYSQLLGQVPLNISGSYRTHPSRCGNDVLIHLPHTVHQYHPQHHAAAAMYGRDSPFEIPFSTATC